VAGNTKTEAQHTRIASATHIASAASHCTPLHTASHYFIKNHSSHHLKDLASIIHIYLPICPSVCPPTCHPCSSFEVDVHRAVHDAEICTRLSVLLSAKHKYTENTASVAGLQHGGGSISQILVYLMFKIGEKRSRKIFIGTYDWKHHKDLVGYEGAMFFMFSNMLKIGYLSRGADKRIYFSRLSQWYDTKYRWLARSVCCALKYICMSGGLRNGTWLKYDISAIMYLQFSWISRKQGSAVQKVELGS
jgi:hypothetical protein